MPRSFSLPTIGRDPLRHTHILALGHTWQPSFLEHNFKQFHCRGHKLQKCSKCFLQLFRERTASQDEQSLLSHLSKGARLNTSQKH